MAVATLNPDPHPETSSVDGNVQFQSGTSWASARDAVTGDGVNDTGNTAILMIRRDGADDWVDFRRIVTVFDGAEIPKAATIDSVDYKIKTATKDTNTFTDSLTLCEALPGGNTGLVVGDYDIATKFGSTKFATDVTVASLTAGAFSTWSMNASGIAYIQARIAIDKIFKLGLLCTTDFADAEPGGSGDGRTQNSFNMAESTGNEPILEVTFTSHANFFLVL